MSAIGVTADNGGFWPRMSCPLMTQDGHSGEAAGQLHDFTNAGGVEIVDAPGEPDDAFGRSRLKSCRQTVADLDEMLRLADRRRAPLAARTIAARLEDASAVELDPQQHIHLLETARDLGVETEFELAEQLLHVGLGEPRIREGANSHLAIEQRAGRGVLQRELARQTGLGPRPVDVVHYRRGQDHMADRGRGRNIWMQLEPGGDAEMGSELARKHLNCIAGL